MDCSTLLARLLGPFIVAIGIGFLLKPKAIKQIGEDFFKNWALVYVSGLVTFIGGLAVVLFHNLWAADWRLIITLMGWLMLVKGAWLIVLPRTLVKATEVYTRNTKLGVVIWIVMLALGLILMFQGYLA